MLGGVLASAPAAWADVSDDGFSDDGSDGSDDGCNVTEECPESGEFCEFSSNTSCDDAAKKAGLERRCDAPSGIVYCDPEETSGCAAALRPRQPGLSFALAAFGAAAAATFVRARRRAKTRSQKAL
jgi:hypothetical protein